MTLETASTPRRYTALALFVILPLALLLVAAANLAGIADLGTQADATLDQLDRYRTRLASGPVQETPAATSSAFVDAPSRSLAEAELQRRLVALVEASSARVVESSSGAVPEADAGSVIEIRATLDGDNGDLLRFLHAIETGLPLMTIVDLAVRRLQSEDSDLGANPELRIDVVVRAPWKAAVF